MTLERAQAVSGSRLTARRAAEHGGTSLRRRVAAERGCALSSPVRAVSTLHALACGEPAQGRLRTQPSPTYFVVKRRLHEDKQGSLRRGAERCSPAPRRHRGSVGKVLWTIPEADLGNRDRCGQIEACESTVRQVELIQPKVVATRGNFDEASRGMQTGIPRVPVRAGSTAGSRKCSLSASTAARSTRLDAQRAPGGLRQNPSC